MLLVSAFLQACGSSAPATALSRAEDAVADGMYGVAQSICDDLSASAEFDRLSVDELCRLSLVYVKLGENTDNADANIIAAARSLQAAAERDADSTALFLDAVPVEDRARMAIISAINEAHNTPLLGDTLNFDITSYDE